MIDLLGALQRGVQKMNTAKTNIYQLHVLTDAEYLSELTAASSAIFAEFARYFGKEESFLVLAEKTLLLKRLQEEQAFYESYHLSTLKRAYEHGFFAKESAAAFEDWLTNIIDTVKHEIKDLKTTCESLSSVLDLRLQEMLAR